MKLVMTLLVRDEEDIIGENIEFHILQGVDFFLVMDNNSIDNTKNILKKYEESGILKYYYKDDDVFKQEEWVTFMSREAFSLYGADWIINNDADEFWFPKYHKSLKNIFEGLGKNKNLLIAERSNFVLLKEETDKKFYSSMLYKETFSINDKGKRLSPKIAYKASLEISVSHGNHGIESGLKKILPVSDLIEILHFPIRHKRQYERKIINLGLGLLQNKKHSNNIRATLYKKFKEDNTYLENKYYSESYSYKDILTFLEQGSLIKDTRLRDKLEDIYYKSWKR